jgi:hypothetical protein
MQLAQSRFQATQISLAHSVQSSHSGARFALTRTAGGDFVAQRSFAMNIVIKRMVFRDFLVPSEISAAGGERRISRRCQHHFRGMR